VWELGSVSLLFGVIGGAAAMLFGLALGGLAACAKAGGRWQKTASATQAGAALAPSASGGNRPQAQW
jgi:hypothetical protein